VTAEAREPERPRNRGRRAAVTLAALTAVLLYRPVSAAAEWQLKPFLGVTFGGNTTFVDPDHAAGDANVALGLGAALLGDVVGVDADLGYAPGFFQSGEEHLVVRSRVTTLTGNVVIALPRRLTQYTLRPYFVGGAGLMRVRIDTFADVLKVSSSLLATDVGAGVTGFLTDRIGLNWDLRRFASRSKNAPLTGISIGPEDLSFWRASMALAIRL